MTVRGQGIFVGRYTFEHAKGAFVQSYDDSIFCVKRVNPRLNFEHAVVRFVLSLHY